MSAHKIIHQLFIGCLLCLSVMGMSAAQAASAAGQVIIASGSVQAIAASGAVRELQRRSPFFAGETIRTHAASTVQLRFSDGALLSLREDSELKVDAYEFQNQGGDGDRSMSTLIKGGLRTITGVIGKQDPSAYELSTPVATIGVRGTHYEAVLEAPDSLVLAAWQGGIQVRNENGVVDLGVGAEFNFARSEHGQRPQGLLEAPTALRASTPIGRLPAKQQSSTAQQADADEDATHTTAETAADSGMDAFAATGTESDAIAAPDANTDDKTAFGSVFASPLNSSSSDTLCSNCAPPQQLLVTQPGDLPTVTDKRFSTSEWNQLLITPYLGIAMMANSTPDFGIKGGRVLNFGSNTPVFTDNGYGPGEPNYATAPIQDVIRIGGASSDAFGSYVVDAAHTVYWGTWNGSTNPVTIQTDANDPAIVKPVYNPVHWATMLPTDLGAIAARNGTVSYNSVIVAHGGGSGGGPLTPGNVSFNADVNFTTGNISNGSLNINNGPETWLTVFSGKITGNVLDVNLGAASIVTVSPSITPQPVEGDIGMAFTGNTGQAIGGGFTLQAIGNPATHVEGVLLVQ